MISVNNVFSEMATTDSKEKGSSFQSSHNRDYHHQPMSNMRQLKMDFPPFFGDDPTEWLDSAAQFFECHGTNPEQRVALPSFHRRV